MVFGTFLVVFGGFLVVFVECLMDFWWFLVDFWWICLGFLLAFSHEALKKNENTARRPSGKSLRTMGNLKCPEAERKSTAAFKPKNLETQRKPSNSLAKAPTPQTHLKENL